MSELSPTAREILDAMRSGDQPDPEAQERIRRGLMIRIAAATGAATATGCATEAASGAGAKAGVSGLFASTVGKVVIVACLGTGLVTSAVGVWALRSQTRIPKAAAVLSPSALSQPANEPELVASAASAEPVQSTAPLPEPAKTVAVMTSAPASGASRSTPIPSASKFEEEMVLLREAHSELQKGNAPKALQLLDEHQARYPRGVLAEERQAARILALCKAGRQGEGRALADAFLQRAPGSPLAARIRAACPR